MSAEGQAKGPKTGRVEMRDIVKCFPGVTANDGVCLDVEPGEVHALLGENGAGKSTLMRQLYGMYQPDEGLIFVDGKPLVFRSPADAIRAGIGMIHQHFMLVPTMTVAQNVALGQRSPRAPFLDLAGVSKAVARIGEDYGLKVDPDAFVWQLSVGEQQRVEIIKALYRGAGLIILDEPTAVLTPQEVDALFATLRTLVASGHSLIFISHKLNEVKAISDRVTVLRDGKVVGTGRTCDLTRGDLVRMMVGREVKEPDPRPHAPGPELVRLTGLRAMGDRGLEALRGIDLSIRSGEILGLAGVSGNGQKELAECLAGMRPLAAGSVFVEGRDMTLSSVNERFEAGMAFIPEERMRDGAIREFSVGENVFLHDHMSKRFRRWIFLAFDKMREHSSSLVDKFSVKTPSLDVPIKNLSGGNIQKLIMARELSREPFFLVAAQPTRGVDIGATEYIHDCLLEQREKGMAILLVSEDLDELRSLSDRIAVMYEGGIMGIVDRGTASVEELGFMMAGVSLEELRSGVSAEESACP
ncbi:MAG TPA: ABC transporter ATP-binding protein [Rectinemataceae bacterium]|nr:ABC transporter ATP-binding protein [Rectinemataceae bacterium]